MNRIKSVFVRNLVSGSLDTDSASSRGSIIPTRNYTIFATRAKITARRREKVIWIRCKSYEITRERVFIYYEKRILGRNCKTVRIFVYYFRINKTKVREKIVCNVVRPLRMKNETLPNYRGDKPNPVSTPRFLLLPN